MWINAHLKLPDPPLQLLYLAVAQPSLSKRPYYRQTCHSDTCSELKIRKDGKMKVRRLTGDRLDNVAKDVCCSDAADGPDCCPRRCVALLDPS